MRSGPEAPQSEWQLKKGAQEIVKTETADPTRPTSAPRIRCPKCRWQPERASTWVCWSGPGPEPPFESCGTAWHTFDTGGRCPGCGHQWHWTTCLSCGEWSPHLDWYENPAQED